MGGHNWLELALFRAQFQKHQQSVQIATSAQTYAAILLRSQSLGNCIMIAQICGCIRMPAQTCAVFCFRQMLADPQNLL